MGHWMSWHHSIYRTRVPWRYTVIVAPFFYRWLDIQRRIMACR